MAILQFFEIWEGREHGLNDQREREYTRTFKVIVSDPTIDPATIRLYPACPRVWQIYSSAQGLVDSGSWCREVRVKQDTADPYIFHVTCQYSSRVERPDLNLIENPLLRPADIDWDTDARSRVAWSDRDGQPILNSAGERFDPSVDVEENIVKLTISRNQASYDPFGYVQFINATNSHAWFNQPPGRVRCGKIKGARQFENGLLFWRAVFEFYFRENLDADPDATTEEAARDAWATRVLDQGWMELVGGKRVVATDPLGRPYGAPVLLDGNGAKLAVGASPVFLTFYLNPQKDFRDLNLV